MEIQDNEDYHSPRDQPEPLPAAPPVLLLFRADFLPPHFVPFIHLLKNCLSHINSSCGSAIRTRTLDFQGVPGCPLPHPASTCNSEHTPCSSCDGSHRRIRT